MSISTPSVDYHGFHLRRIHEPQFKHLWWLLFWCFFLRAINCLPGDIVTMYLGTTHTPFLKNMIGGIFGLLPGTILATLLGSNIKDPTSPAFWLSAILFVVLSAGSLLMYYIYQKKSKSSCA